MLHAWLQSLCTAASTNTPALRLPLYDFLETASCYPPDPETATAGAGGANSSTPGGYPSSEVPCATATPYAESIDAAGGAMPLPQPPPPEPAHAKQRELGTSDGWAVPMESRETSDVKLAMSGPDTYGRLAAAKAAEALRQGTGASSDDLRAIWELSDIDKDGMLDREEVRACAGVEIGG